MNSTYSGASRRFRQVRDAQRGPHRGALSAPDRLEEEFAVGDVVEVKLTKLKTKVRVKTAWKDYEVEGVTGYYSARQLRLIQKAR